jgi:Ca2+-binding EF-hand superfamily protein
MLTALVLVCSVAAAADLATCDRENAIDIMRIPEQFASPVMCAMQAQAYLAQTAIGQNMTNNESVKVMCFPSATVDSATIRPVVSQAALTEREILDTFSILDTDGNGQVTRTEYEMNKTIIINPDAKPGETSVALGQTRLSRQAFDAADVDHDGTLSPLEIANVLRFEVVDADSKGYLVFEDLRQFMRHFGR